MQRGTGEDGSQQQERETVEGREQQRERGGCNPATGEREQKREREKEGCVTQQWKRERRRENETEPGGKSGK